MSDEANRKLPVAQSGRSGSPSIFTPQPAHTGGIIDTWVTRWQAKRKTAAHNELAALNRAKRDELDAYGQMAESYMRTARTVHQLDELPEILALDRAQRQADRVAQYARIEYEADERQHQKEHTERRRKRELIDDDHAVYNAQRKLDYRQRLKQQEEELWTTRKEAKLLDEQARVAEIRAVLEEHDASTSTSPVVSDPIEVVLAARREAIADGRDPTPYDVVIAEFVAKRGAQK